MSTLTKTTTTTTIMVIEYFEESPMFTHSDMLTGAKTASSWEVRQVNKNWENYQKDIEEMFLKKLRENKMGFVQGSDLELFYWEADTGNLI